ncbi:hypothetical protein PILCRDRAFT_15725 [Piloderma croceum F 1598]|uniref:DUF6830 domain-containing protein n=1 Tax=Piloderma croceum (strain F 1598) TaxID=765440 RepID=A0A0C3EYQ2_PILCF|nr:hypothetical protein PILCRDRAFT_15725 [Piloderma croceum F 1598]
MASPPSKEWPVERYDTVLVNMDPSKKWPHSGLEGHTVAWLRLIFRICGAIPAADRFLAYVQRYHIIPQPSVSAQTSHGGKTDPITGLYALKRALRADKSYLGDVIPVSRL